MLRLISKIFNIANTSIKNILYPNQCLSCKKEITGTTHALCPNCWHKLQFITEPCCTKCGSQIPETEKNCIACMRLRMGMTAKQQNNYGYTDKIVSPLRYSGKIKSMIAKFKYNKKLGYAHLFSTIIMQKLYHHLSKDNEKWVIIAIPLHKDRLHQRGYNQAEIIAHHLTQILQKNFVIHERFHHKINVVGRSVNNKQQANLSLKERINNSQGIFFLEEKYKKYVAGKNILLIDDVITSGSTINECSKVLKVEGKAKKIYGISVARTCIGFDEEDIFI